MEKEKDAESVCSSENLLELIAALKINRDEKIMAKPKPRFDCFIYTVVVILLCLFVGGLIVNMNHLNTIMEDTSRIKYQNKRNFAMMNQLKSQYRNIESQMTSILRVSRATLAYPELSKELKEKVFRAERFLVMKELNRTEEIIEKTCMSLKPSTRTKQPRTGQLTSTTTIPTTTIPVKPATQVVLTPAITPKLPKHADIKVPHFNAASYLSGASVLFGLSSRPVNSSEFSFDQSSYAILEREPVPNKAWCTNSKTPYITISLSKYVRPIAVSYQHLKWNGSIPDGAPMEYDVVACYEKSCKVEVPLALNCKYESSGPQEQKCLVPLSGNYVPEVDWIRFNFRKTYGNSKTICAYLIRVFAEGTVKPMKPSKETCSSLIWHQKNSPFLYNYILEKNCKVWYNNDCCADCPECCTECVAKDMNYKLLLPIGMFILSFIGIMIGFYRSVKAEERRRLRSWT